MGDFIGEPYRWAKSDGNGYECSSAGDVRFSAFNAKIQICNEVWTIECFYQVVVKGYMATARSSGLPRHMWWKIGKGKPPKRKLSKRELYLKYLAIWRKWADNNPELIDELSIVAKGKVLTDRFASTDINQAHALCDVLNEKYGK